MLKMLQLRAEFHAFCCFWCVRNYIFFDLIRDHLMISLVIFQQRRAYCEYCIPFLQVSLPAVCVVVC